MRILVTGANGFLGHHVMAQFRRAGYDKNILTPRSAELNLIDNLAVDQYFTDNRPDTVVHLAADCGGIGLNMRKPADLWSNNTIMGANVLQSCAWHQINKLVMVSTTCAYPKDAPMPYREEDLWNGFPEPTNAAYAIAKRSLMVGAEAYQKQYGLHTVCLIPTNLYGPHDHFDLNGSHVIPALVKRFDAAQKSVTLWGTGKATRDFLYATDAAEAILRAVEMKNAPSVPINVGSGREISIRETAEMVRDLMGRGDVAIEWDHSKPDGQPRRYLDITRAKERLGWVPSTTLEKGLQLTVDWYKKNRDWCM